MGGEESGENGGYPKKKAVRILRSREIKIPLRKEEKNLRRGIFICIFCSYFRP